MIRVFAESRPAVGEFPPPTLTVLAGAVAANVAAVRAKAKVQMMAVVKADGYGHGAVSVARVAVAAGAQWLGTTDLAQAYELRRAGLTEPILAWLNPAGIDAGIAATARIDVAVGSVGELDALGRPGAVPVRVHLCADTGMGREGCPDGDWARLVSCAEAAQRRGAIQVVGLMGHLACPDDVDANRLAAERFVQARRSMLRAGLRAPLSHLAATTAALHDPTTHFDLVRVGAGLVGIDPSGRVGLAGASRLTAPVVHSAAVGAGTRVGYGGWHTTAAPTNLAVLPIGYADGIPRQISPEAEVELGGKRRRIVGQVSMDQIVVDTGADAFPRGAVATVFGPGGGVAPTIQDWAGWAGTIPHTIVTGVGRRVRRVVA
jgi:alanine racemase